VFACACSKSRVGRFVAERHHILTSSRSVKIFAPRPHVAERQNFHIASMSNAKVSTPRPCCERIVALHHRAVDRVVQVSLLSPTACYSTNVFVWSPQDFLLINEASFVAGV